MQGEPRDFLLNTNFGLTRIISIFLPSIYISADIGQVKQTNKYYTIHNIQYIFIMIFVGIIVTTDHPNVNTVQITVKCIHGP
jgi:hypothetical protein